MTCSLRHRLCALHSGFICSLAGSGKTLCHGLHIQRATQSECYYYHVPQEQATAPRKTPPCSSTFSKREQIFRSLAVSLRTLALGHPAARQLGYPKFTPQEQQGRRTHESQWAWKFAATERDKFYLKTPPTGQTIQTTMSDFRGFFSLFELEKKFKSYFCFLRKEFLCVPCGK